MHRLASLTSTGLGTVAYGYDDYGKLTTITRGSTTYSLTYDAWNRPISTKVGTTALSTNTYDSDFRLSTVTYANGFSARYVYDDLDRVRGIYQTENNTESFVYSFIYNGEGDLYELRNYRTHRASFFEYDHAGRCMASRERAFTVSGGKITYGATLSAYKYQYDECNNLSKLTCSVLGSKWSTVYTYDDDNRPSTTTLSTGKVISNTYDALGRLQKRTIGLNSDYETRFEYYLNGDNRTTLLHKYYNGSDDPFVYNYDDNGNITSITQGSTSITYEYDAANRLTRENNQVTNQTVTYEYDTWGNILNKKIYAYTTATNPGTPTSTITYTYGNNAWKDQLTSYAGQTISYDSMGNPTSYRGYTFGWRGKQLVSASNGTNSLTFEYNEDGLRQKKTVNNVSTDYYYNGSVLIGMQRGTTKYRFSYDASGNVVSVKIGTDEYYYIRNAQGDVIKLIDASGAAVVQYTYDTWGKAVTTTGTLAGTLGLFQPFRYRGYVYDWETGFYYLQSRYYDPTTGRFISADVLLSTGQGVLGHNCYAYCRDNPSSRSDSNGKEDEDVNGAVYIIYTNYSSEENNGNDAGDFTEQANYYAEITGCPEENMFAIQTVDDFIETWNTKIGETADSVYIFSHGNGMSLIFLYGEGISATGYNKKGEAINAIYNLKPKSIHELYLMSCNSGHRDLYDKQGTNAAAAFVRLGGIDKVYAFDGSMGYNRIFNRKARLSHSQHGFYAVYEDFHIVKQHPEPFGWVVYVPAW